MKTKAEDVPGKEAMVGSHLSISVLPVLAPARLLSIPGDPRHQHGAPTRSVREMGAKETEWPVGQGQRLSQSSCHLTECIPSFPKAFLPMTSAEMCRIL